MFYHNSLSNNIDTMSHLSKVAYGVCFTTCTFGWMLVKSVRRAFKESDEFEEKYGVYDGQGYTTPKTMIDSGNECYKAFTKDKSTSKMIVKSESDSTFSYNQEINGQLKPIVYFQVNVDKFHLNEDGSNKCKVKYIQVQDFQMSEC